MEKDTEDAVDRRSWHIGKEVPLALIFAFAAQTVGLIWSVSGLYNKVDTLVQVVAEIRNERYTKEDGRRDRDAQIQRDNEQDRRLNKLEVGAEALFNRLIKP